MNLLGLTEPPQPSNVGTGTGIDARSWGSLSPGVLGFSNQEPKNLASWPHLQTGPHPSGKQAPWGCSMLSPWLLTSRPGHGWAGHVSPSHVLGSSAIPGAQANLGIPAFPPCSQGALLGDLGAPQGHSGALSHSGLARNSQYDGHHTSSWELQADMQWGGPNPSLSQFTLESSEDTRVRAILHPWGLRKWPHGPKSPT